MCYRVYSDEFIFAVSAEDQALHKVSYYYCIYKHYCIHYVYSVLQLLCCMSSNNGCMCLYTQIAIFTILLYMCKYFTHMLLTNSL